MKSITLFRFLAGSAALALATPYARAQTRVDLRTQSKSVDFSAASSTKPFQTGTTLPGACSQGQTFFKTNAAPGANFYACTSLNTWTLESGSGGDVNTTANATFGAHTYDFTLSTLLIPNSAISTVYLNSLYPQLAANNSYAAGKMNSFSHDATLPGFRLVPQIGNPGTLSDGAIWYNSSTPAFTARENGVTVRLATSGANTFTGNQTLTGTFNLAQQTPASSSAACTANQFAFDTGFIYVCTATNTWKRAALSTW